MADAGPAAEPLTLRAADDRPVAATRYPVPNEKPDEAPNGVARASLVVAGAIGVPQRFYGRFAAHAARAGFATLTLDYRGVGRSAPPSLRGFAADCLDWARLDLAAAIDAARAHAPSLPLVLVGHSFGGQAIGLLPDPHAIAAAYLFGTGAGWHGWMSPRERVRVLALWRVAGPLLTQAMGYLPSRRLGLGEDLPLGVYRQWRRWCAYPRYFFDDPEMSADVTLQFARVRAPIAAAAATDDPWAPPRSRDAFMSGYANAPWEAVDIAPEAAGARTIGHHGYFRSSAAPLWDAALDWLAERAAATSVRPTP